jgi:hypothetical protein
MSGGSGLGWPFDSLALSLARFWQPIIELWD